MAKIERNEDGIIIAYIAKNVTDDTRIPVYFISYQDCLEYCKLMQRKHNMEFKPVKWYQSIGIPPFVNWSASKEHHYEAIYYSNSELEL